MPVSLRSGRFFYTRSYASGNPDLRNKQGGLLHYVGYIGASLALDLLKDGGGR